MNTTTRTDLTIPSDRDWSGWISATQTRNWMKKDPLLDWLELYGTQSGFIRDTQLPTYIAEADFTQFILRKGREFETCVLGIVADRLSRAGLAPITQIAHEPSDARSERCRAQTITLMRQGTPVISKGVVWDEQLALYGVPDLLVRSDFLHVICDCDPSYEARTHGAPKLESSGFHYVVVDIKYRGFALDSSGEASNEAGHYKVQLAIYNAALGSTQGYMPPQAFFIGRKWSKGSGQNADGATSCLDRLIPVSLPVQAQFRAEPINWLDRAIEAAEWIRRLRIEGSSWKVLPAPSVEELYPNMKNAQDSPWHNAKKEIAAQIGEPTQVWQLGVDVRKDLVRHGSGDWRNSAFRMDLLGNGNGSTTARRTTMLGMNRNPDAPLVHPRVLDWARDEWAVPEPLEFFVDFETTSNLDDDFLNLPEIGGQPLIFMIGCGHWEPIDELARKDASWSLNPAKRRWIFKVFYTEALTEHEEKRIIFEWHEHMDEVRKSTPGAPIKPKVFHWSPAETRTYSMGSDSAFVRHLRPAGWPEPNWYDFLQSVVKPKGRSEAVYVKGAWGFGLKAIGKALHSHGLIETLWEDGPADGLAAMGGSWACYRLAEQLGIPVTEVVFSDISGVNHRLFNEVIQYNEVDCRVMAECISYLRGNH